MKVKNSICSLFSFSGKKGKIFGKGISVIILQLLAT